MRKGEKQGIPQAWRRDFSMPAGCGMCCLLNLLEYIYVTRETLYVCVIQYPHSCKFSARFLHTSSHAGNIAGTARDGFADDMSLHLFIGLHTLRQRYAECLN